MANQGWPLNTEYGTNTSRTLLLRVREPQDRQAWEEFVNRYAPQIFNWCRRYQLQESDAADVTQDVLVKLVRTMQDFQYDPARGSFRGWLKTVTANAVRDLVGNWKKAGRGSGDTAVLQVLATIEDEKAIEALSAEIEACHQCLSKELIECPEWSHQDSLNVAEILDEVRRQVGVHYPGRD